MSTLNTPSQPLFKKTAILGVGLIGGSLAAAMKAQQLCPHIVGIGRSQDTLSQALALGLVDAVSTDISAVEGCDLVVLCAPVAQTLALLTAMRPYLSPHTIVTDAGSTKQDVVAAAKTALGDSHEGALAQFVPAHPIAGKEKHGPSAADAQLYLGKRVVLTPIAETHPDAVNRVQALWQALGAVVTRMSPLRHDTIFASVSHLPHLLAYALVAQIAHSEDADTKLDYAGGGFRDFTRIAASSPEMWRDIFAANKTALLKDLRAYQAMLGHFETLLVTDNWAGLEKLITKAATVRQDWGKP
jgi:prephenate dehydrogenase